MKLKSYLAMVPLGIVASVAFAQAPWCVTEMVPCEGPEVVHGYGCSTSCPPSSQGCCAYTTYRVNCDVGQDQYYTVRNCWEVRHCAYIVIPKQFECTVL